jgi:ABC-type glutathione transport system ATPase component
MSCLEVRKASKSFLRIEGRKKHRIQAVDRVSLALHTGESLGIIGTSGCGKTTLINLITGIVKPDMGIIHRHDPVGLVGQDPYVSLCPSLTVAQAVAEPLLFLKRKKYFRDCVGAVEQALGFVNMSYGVYANRLPSQLSGGERQRVGIARALVMEPALLLLDEPTSMVDREVKEELSVLLRSIVLGHKTAFLMVTHDISLAAGICDRILVMERGRIIEENSAQGIINHPQQKLTRDLIRISADVRSYWKETAMYAASG